MVVMAEREIEPATAQHVPRLLDGVVQDGVCAILSPPRILEHTKKQGLRGELSADLTTGWDFLLPEHKENHVNEIHRRRPQIVYMEARALGSRCC